MPHYVSTVDSGNLCAHLLTLENGLVALLDQPIARANTLDGLDDTLGVLVEMVPSEYSENPRPSNRQSGMASRSSGSSSRARRKRLQAAACCSGSSRRPPYLLPCW